jgi:epsilon-lactone hydrolase
MSESFITTFTRLIIKIFLKPILTPSIPIIFQRFWEEFTTRLLPVPTCVRFEHSYLDNVPVEIVRPTLIQQNEANVVLFLHGGAFLVGSPRSRRAIAGKIAQFTGMTIYVVDYRLAPEYPFPASLEDALTCYRLLLQQDITPDRIALVGDSAGGGLALSLCLKLREHGIKQPICLALISPWVDLTNSQLKEVANDVLLNKKWLEQGAVAYCGESAATEPFISPIYADLTGLPPTLIHVGSEEMLFNDSRRLVQNLTKSGISVEIKEFPRLWHDFQICAGLVPEATQSVEELSEFICKTSSQF